MSLVCLDLPFLFQDLTQDITLLVVVLSLLTLLGWDRVSDFFLFLMIILNSGQIFCKMYFN